MSQNIYIYIFFSLNLLALKQFYFSLEISMEIFELNFLIDHIPENKFMSRSRENCLRKSFSLYMGQTKIKSPRISGEFFDPKTDWNPLFGWS